MRIAAAEVIPYWLPFRDEYVTARGRLSRREMVLLRLVDEEGHEGWGEAVPMSLRGGDDLARVITDLESWVRRADGRQAASASPEWADSPGLSAPANCAVQTALADLEARRRGLPLWQLLGAERCEPVPCNATLVSGSADAVAADAERWAADGFITFKLKVGLLADGPAGGRLSRRRGGPLSDPDLSQITAVRDALGAEARIRLDANGAWSVDRAEAVLTAAARSGIELVEQPVATLEEMAELHRRLHRRRRTTGALTTKRPSPLAIPLAADESVNGAAEALTAREVSACDLATVKLSKIGRLRPDLAGALPFYLSSALDGPVGLAAAAHVFQALSDAERASLGARPDAMESADPRTDRRVIDQGLATQRLFSHTIASTQCELRGRWLHVPAGPGLGVEIDPAALAAHRI